MDRRLINRLPSVLAEIKEVQTLINDIEQPEINKVSECTKDAFNDQFINDATENGLKRWESILGITTKKTESNEDRRIRILSRLNESLPYTMRTLERMLAAICGEGNFDVVLYNNTYTLFIKIDVAQYNKKDAVDAMLKRVIPVNMVFHVIKRYNSHRYLSGFKHGELSYYTHEELQRKKLEKVNLTSKTYAELESMTYNQMQLFTYQDLESGE